MCVCTYVCVCVYAFVHVQPSQHTMHTRTYIDSSRHPCLARISCLFVFVRRCILVTLFFIFKFLWECKYLLWKWRREIVTCTCNVWETDGQMDRQTKKKERERERERCMKTRHTYSHRESRNNSTHIVKHIVVCGQTQHLAEPRCNRVPACIVYVRMYVCIYVCVCMYVCMYICVYVCVCVCTYVCAYVWTYLCIRLCMNAWM
jgi:hypothetical protein